MSDAPTLLTRDEILRAPLPFEEVTVPEWGGIVRVYALDGMTRKHYIDAQFGDDGKLRDADRSDAILAAFSIRDGAGALVFTVDDVEALAQQSAAALDRVTEVAKRLSGFTKDAVKAAEKN